MTSVMKIHNITRRQPVVFEEFSVLEDNTALPSPEDQSTLPIRQEDLFAVRAKASSSKNFAVQLIRCLFKPEELQNRNIRGVGGQLPLDPERLDVIKDAVFKYYPAPASGRDCQWRDCKVAIDTFLRSVKYARTH